MCKYSILLIPLLFVSFKYHQLISLKELGDWDDAPAAGFEPVLPSRDVKSQALDHAGAQCSSLSVSLEFKAGMRF